MSNLNEQRHFVGMDSDLSTNTVCVNCGHKQRIPNTSVAFANVHSVCSQCHNYMDIDVKEKEAVSCKHCFAKSYFHKDADKTKCLSCGKLYNEPIEKDRKSDAYIMIFGSNPLSGAITRRYL